MQLAYYEVDPARESWNANGLEGTVALELTCTSSRMFRKTPDKGLVMQSVQYQRRYKRIQLIATCCEQEPTLPDR